MRTERDQDQPYARAAAAPKRRRWRLDGQVVMSPQAYAVREVDRRWKERVAADYYRRSRLVLGPGLVDLQTTSTGLSRISGEAQIRGIVRGWTNKSRRRLKKRARSIEWPRLQLVLATLTQPRHWSTDPEDWKEQLRRFRIRWERRFGKIYALWVMEFQERGAPHFHLAIITPERVPMAVLREWVADNWHEIAGDGDHGCKEDGSRSTRRRGDHRSCFHQHGDHRRCWHHINARSREAVKLARGPLGLIKYLEKELSKGKPRGAKAYQKTLPDYLDDPEFPRGAGRWWGVWNLTKTLWAEPLSKREYQRLRHAARGVLRSRIRLYRPSRHEWLTVYEEHPTQWTLSRTFIRYLDHGIRGRPPPSGSGFREFERRLVLITTIQLILAAHEERAPRRVLHGEGSALGLEPRAFRRRMHPQRSRS